MLISLDVLSKKLLKWRKKLMRHIADSAMSQSHLYNNMEYLKIYYLIKSKNQHKKDILKQITMCDVTHS